MKYRHKKTGVIIDIACEIKGGWEPVEEPQVTKPETTAEKPKKAPAQKRAKK